MTRQTYADNVDANGKVFKTVGDNIRMGARAGELIDYSSIMEKLDALEPEISALQADTTENTLGVKKNSNDISSLNENLMKETVRAENEEKRIEALFTDDVETSVSNWLNDHPEATTTVQDASLTADKFTDDLKKHTLKDYVTPEMFGGVGDGTENDTEAIINALSTKKPVYISGGKTYIINSPINIDKGSSIYGTGVIKAGTSFIGEAMVLVGFNSYSSGLLNGVENQLLNNKIIVDCSNIDNVDGVRIKCSYKTKYDITIRNCKANGVHCGFEYNSNYYAENIYSITGQNDYNTVCDNSILVYAEGSDDIFNDITGCNFHTLVYSYGGYNAYDSVHGYITIDELFNDSVLFLTRIGVCNVNFIYCDGLETAIKIEQICHGLNIKNCYINLNDDVLRRGNIFPLKAKTNERYAFAEGYIYYSNNKNAEIHISQENYDPPFAGLTINANKLSWTSTTGDTSCLFQTDKVNIGTSNNGETGLTPQNDKLPVNYTGYFIIANCKRTCDNFCLQEFINTNGEEFFKTCVESIVSEPASNFNVTKWHKM